MRSHLSSEFLLSRPAPFSLQRLTRSRPRDSSDVCVLEAADRAHASSRQATRVDKHDDAFRGTRPSHQLRALSIRSPSNGHHPSGPFSVRVVSLVRPTSTCREAHRRVAVLPLPIMAVDLNASPIHFSDVYKAHLAQLQLGQLPALPPIAPDLKRAAFTHRSAHGRLVKSFEDSAPDALYADYERLEWEGDSHVSEAATELIAERYPALTVSKKTVSSHLTSLRFRPPSSLLTLSLRPQQLKTALVANATLGQIARAYGFPAQLIAHPAQVYMLRRK